MASTTLYPVTVDAAVSSFVASGDAAYSRLYFSLSRFSTSMEAIRSIHLSVIKQSTGQSVVNKTNNTETPRYRNTGLIIINTPPIAVEDAENLYYVDILNEDIMSGDKVGWQPGWIYKAQIRLSTVAADTTPTLTWLNKNADCFSEWSTYCTFKATSQPRITVPIMLNYDSSVEGDSSEKTYTLSLSTLEFDGSYSNSDSSESLYSYSLKLYQDDKLIEDSGLLYNNQYITPNQFHYIFSHEFIDDEVGLVRLEYTTINNFSETYDFNVNISQTLRDETTILPVTIDYAASLSNEAFVNTFKDLTTIDMEEQEGRIGIKLYSSLIEPYNGNICIRRSDSKDNFSTWTDVKMIICTDTVINNLDIVFDNTIESGVWYKYGVQLVKTNGTRGLLNVSTTAVIRNFEYSYLVGEGGRQLKLQFNNTMSTFSYTYLDAKVDTLGGLYPHIIRSGETKYRTFPVSALVSFNMDENALFASDLDLYKYSNIVENYKDYNRANNINLYDYKKEFEFREAVLDFLQDGKPKLFKSPTEGNIIVRLMNVTTTPDQTLNRMISTVNSTAYEIAENTLENYINFGFLTIGEYSKSFSTFEAKIGQIELSASPLVDNIIEKIWEKYDTSKYTDVGSTINLNKIYDLSIEFESNPKQIKLGTYTIAGYGLQYNRKPIGITAESGGIYHFDPSITFTKGSELYVLGGQEDKDSEPVDIVVNFIYEQEVQLTANKEILASTSECTVGQVFNAYKPGSNLYNELYYKYYMSTNNSTKVLTQITWTNIEADPGTVFSIQDASDITASYVDINWTGVLNLADIGAIQGLAYEGVRNSDGTIDTTQNRDILIDYIAYTTTEVYEEV